MQNTSTDQKFEPLNPNFEHDARASFASQGIMHLLGATLRTIGPGVCVIELPFNPNLSQQDGFFHAGATSTIADSAGGYAAYSLMPAGSRVLTVEFKINLLSPASGERLVATASVIKPGRTLSVATIDVTVEKNGHTKLCATMQQTTICITNPA